MIPVECSSCGAEFQVPDSAAGKMVRCRRCDGVTPVPVIEEYSEDFAEDLDSFDVEESPSLPPPRKKSGPSPNRRRTGGATRRKSSLLAARDGAAQAPSGNDPVAGPSALALRVQGALIAVAGMAVIGLAFGVGYLMNVDNVEDPPGDVVADTDAAVQPAAVPANPPVDVIPPVSPKPSPRPNNGRPSTPRLRPGKPPGSAPKPGPVQGENAATAARPGAVPGTRSKTGPNTKPVAGSSLPGDRQMATETPPRRPPAPVYDRSTHAVFESLLLDEPATSMALTEDRRFLVITHQSTHMVSVYDLETESVTATMSTESPRSVLCRGDQVFVANYGEGTISVFSISSGWKQTNELMVGKKYIVHLSAAQADNFAGELLVTCHVPDSRSYGGTTYFVDVARDRHKEIGGHALACVSYDGRLAKTQGSFNLSPSGGMGFFPWKTFVDGKPERLYAGGISQTPYTYQLYPGSLWFGDNQVFGGNPIRVIREDMGDILMGDVSQKLAYAMDQDLITPHRVDASMTQMNWAPRRVVLPESGSQFSCLAQRVYRRRDYLLDHNIAVTRDDVLHLFVQNLTNGAILHARTDAFQAVPAPRSNASLKTLLEQTQKQASDPVLPNAEAVESKQQPAGDDSASLNNASLNAASVEPSATRSSDDLFRAWPKYIVAGQKFAWKIPPNNAVGIEVADAESALHHESGQLTWQPAAADVGTHEFKLRVTENGAPRFERLRLEVISRQLADSVDGDLSRLNQFPRLALQNDAVQVVHGRGERRSLILQGDRLVVIGRTLKDSRTRELPRRYTFIDERAGEYIAVAQSPAVLEVLDARTLQVKRSVNLSESPIEIQEITDLAVHPGQHTCCLCVKSGIELPRFRVLRIDEDSGEVAATAIIGNWAEYAGEGRFLWTGYSDLFRTGTNFHVNPDWRLIATPKYGGIDMLLTWDVSGRRPRLLEVVEEAGGNGRGIRVTAAEDRVVYLSHVGSPPHSRSLIGFPARTSAQPQVTYATQDVAGTRRGAFHPLLPLYVAINQNSVGVFDADTGERQDNRLLATTDGLAGDPMTDVLFSDGGQSMLLVRSDAVSGPYLQEIGLRTDASEFAAAQQREPVLPQVPQFVTVPRDELTSLREGPITRGLKPERIGEAFMPSVVIVQTPEGTGTGFVVGPKGYLVTCAHVVESGADVMVQYADPRNTKQIVRRQATVLNADYDLDIALLKLELNSPVSPVHFRGDGDMATGAAVTVIGHPGAGAEILEYTMTTGIVSSASRKVDGVDTIQISAAVNPGNSGGPVFDANGNVAGMVASKAPIEGASFAINIQVIREFLMRVSK
ncbi:MAG: trypsin-like peptidase domain-containing protein [Planctomycetaceae bacterium]|nr:trypsin-like peptidase domain-containing protein [Planctomycetaceae bacterium]